MNDRQQHGRRKSSLLSQYSADMGTMISRRRSEEALLAASLESELANKTKSEFLANMSHELRTPLNAIIGFSDFIQHLAATGQPSDKTVDYAANIAQAGRHLLNIINDILDISKIESGSFSLNFDECDLVELLESCITLVEPRIVEKKQLLERRIAPDLPVLNIDTRRIKQVVINLLSNAQKFTPEGGRILIMATGAVDGGVTIAVADTGIGMTKEQIDCAMKPFGQVQSSYSRNHEGTGLGLPIAKALVRQHGGEFHLSSQPKEGTSVLFTLPARPAHSADASREGRP
ncbi:MAG: sensor histidine kinase [Rhizobiales bacterium]|nr:sensor histidine kinase [Hyphomicrobiales bacterium]